MNPQEYRPSRQSGHSSLFPASLKPAFSRCHTSCSVHFGKTFSFSLLSTLAASHLAPPRHFGELGWERRGLAGELLVPETKGIPRFWYPRAEWFGIWSSPAAACQQCTFVRLFSPKAVSTCQASGQRMLPISLLSPSSSPAIAG